MTSLRGGWECYFAGSLKHLCALAFQKKLFQKELHSSEAEKREGGGWINFLQALCQNLGCGQPWTSPIKTSSIHHGFPEEIHESPIQMARTPEEGASGECSTEKHCWRWQTLGFNQNSWMF